MKYKISVNDQKFEVEIKDIKEGIAEVNVNGQPFDVLIENYEDITAGLTPSGPVATHAAAPATATTPAPAPSPKPTATPSKVSTPTADRIAAPTKPAVPVAAAAPKKMHAAGEIVAPIPGRIMDVKVKVGDSVTKGQTVATMEAMKMENNIASTIEGVVQEVLVQKDSEVATDQVIMVVG